MSISRTSNRKGTFCLKMSAIPQNFGTVDQVLFIVSISISIFIGIYFGCISPKQQQDVYYLLGGRAMKIVPTAFSMVATFISGLAVVGVPSEIYVYGGQHVYSTILYWLSAYVYSSQILPVFHALQGLSIHEYFEKRFDKRIRLLISALFFLNTVLLMPVNLYVPALAYEQVTGYNKYYITPIVCFVCIFYTSVGGLKAVVWTDAIQLVSIFACIILVAVKGTYDIGASAIWKRAIATTRLEPPIIDFDPTVRLSFFSVVIGGFFLKLRGGYLHQCQIQRHQSLPTLSHARKAVWIMLVFAVSLQLLIMYIGLVVAAFYYKCDPFTAKVISKKDQILPLFVMHTVGDLSGITGLFLAGIFSASLSTLSTVFNTLSGVFVEDFIRGYTKWNPSESEATWIMRIFVVVIGIVTLSLIFVVAQLGMMVQLQVCLEAIFTGAMFTITITALFFPWVSSLGALIGAAVSVLSIAPIVIGSQYSISQKLLHFPAKPISVDGCTQMFNVSAEFVKSVKPSWDTMVPYGPTTGDVWYPFRISFLYYVPISLTCGLIAAMLVTLFISRADLHKLDPSLIAPISKRWLPEIPHKRTVVTNGEESQHMMPIEAQLQQ